MSEQHHEYGSGAPGAILRKHRIEAGLSVRETAERLNLLVSHIEALEENDFSRLSGDLFVRGYVQSYARLLDLPVKSLLQATEELLRSDGSQSAASHHAPPRSASVRPRHPALRPVLALLVAILIWSLAVYMYSDSDSDGAADNGLSSLVDPRSFGLETMLVSAWRGRSGADSRQQEPLVAAPARLSLACSEDCWVHIRDANGKTVLSGMQQRGELLLEVKAPVEVVLAYWPAVTLLFNDQRVALKEYAMGNTMRIRLGDGV